eukprot:CAMPEP_0184491702 /NCGR_PEP_ID=MMETSP0113_2-20130426/21165_1 /TAXON_ID=91329 /ORGANISM="Norrisiella sphaerica, Strain BC52" /LENGTH=1099 /DNA_ID=CAMNT_0026876177 /DNA_START=74 /DNA_END=3373 /DNA_ORIENTATION=-
MKLWKQLSKIGKKKSNFNFVVSIHGVDNLPGDRLPVHCRCIRGNKKHDTKVAISRSDKVSWSDESFTFPGTLYELKSSKGKSYSRKELVFKIRAGRSGMGERGPLSLMGKIDLAQYTSKAKELFVVSVPLKIKGGRKKGPDSRIQLKLTIQCQEANSSQCHEAEASPHVDVLSGSEESEALSAMSELDTPNCDNADIPSFGSEKDSTMSRRTDSRMSHKRKGVLAPVQEISDSSCHAEQAVQQRKLPAAQRETSTESKGSKGADITDHIAQRIIVDFEDGVPEAEDYKERNESEALQSPDIETTFPDDAKSKSRDHKSPNKYYSDASSLLSDDTLKKDFSDLTKKVQRDTSEMATLELLKGSTLRDLSTVSGDFAFGAVRDASFLQSLKKEAVEEKQEISPGSIGVEPEHPAITLRKPHVFIQPTISDQGPPNGHKISSASLVSYADSQDQNLGLVDHKQERPCEINLNFNTLFESSRRSPRWNVDSEHKLDNIITNINKVPSPVRPITAGGIREHVGDKKEGDLVRKGLNTAPPGRRASMPAFQWHMGPDSSTSNKNLDRAASSDPHLYECSYDSSPTGHEIDENVEKSGPDVLRFNSESKRLDFQRVDTPVDRKPQGNDIGEDKKDSTREEPENSSSMLPERSLLFIKREVPGESRFLSTALTNSIESLSASTAQHMQTTELRNRPREQKVLTKAKVEQEGHQRSDLQELDRARAVMVQRIESLCTRVVEPSLQAGDSSLHVGEEAKWKQSVVRWFWNSIPIMPCVVVRCLNEWKAFTLRNQWAVSHVIECIQTKLKHCIDLSKRIGGLGSISMLIHLLSGHLETKMKKSQEDESSLAEEVNVVKQAINDLRLVGDDVFSTITKEFLEMMPKMSCKVITSGEESGLECPILDVYLARCEAILSMLQSQYCAPSLQCQVLQRLFRSFTCMITNSLLLDSDYRRLCNAQGGLGLKVIISTVDAWLSESAPRSKDLQLVKEELLPLRDICNVLLLGKSVKYTPIRGLNLARLEALASRYNSNDAQDRILEDDIKAMRLNRKSTVLLRKGPQEIAMRAEVPDPVKFEISMGRLSLSSIPIPDSIADAPELRFLLLKPPMRQ